MARGAALSRGCVDTSPTQLLCWRVLEAWCSGLTCSPVKAETAGSNPVASAEEHTNKEKNEYCRVITPTAVPFSSTNWVLVGFRTNAHRITARRAIACVARSPSQNTTVQKPGSI